MENNKLGQEPMFASSFDVHTGFDSLGNKEFTRENIIGASKRFYAACAAMQGMLSNMEYQKASAIVAKRNNVEPDEWLVKTAYSLADELLKQENQ